MFEPIIVCDHCHQEFEEVDAHFYFNRKKNKHYTWCKECHKQMTAILAKDRKPIHRKRPLSSDPTEARFINMYRYLAAKSKGKFPDKVIATKELIEMHNTQQGRCAYTGLEYSLTERGPLYMTIDRIDNTKGYSKTNVCLCCWFVNCAKNVWPLEQMKQLWKHLPTV